jgi:hypothetical protein
LGDVDLPVVRVDASVQREGGKMKDFEKIFIGFMVGSIVAIAILVVIDGQSYLELKQQGVALLESDMDIRVLMSGDVDVALFATDTGYVLYDGERLYVEMDRCKPVDPKGE